MKRTIIQIATQPEGHPKATHMGTYGLTLALCNDGTLWRRPVIPIDDPREPGWEQYPEIPQPEIPQPESPQLEDLSIPELLARWKRSTGGESFEARREAIRDKLFEGMAPYTEEEMRTAGLADTAPTPTAKAVKEHLDSGKLGETGPLPEEESGAPEGGTPHLRKKPLEELTPWEYKTLTTSGYLFHLYPEATGNYATDTQKPTA